AIFPACYFVMIGAGQTAFARHILPTLPFLCTGAAFLVTEAARALGGVKPVSIRTTTAAGLFAFVVALPSAWAAIQTDRLLARTDNRMSAAQWIRDRFPQRTTIYQSGSIYGQIQMTALEPQSVGRYPNVIFDDASAAFYSADGKKATLPDLIILTR